MLLINAATFIICNYKLSMISYVELILSESFGKFYSTLTITVLKADGDYLSEYNFQHYTVNIICDTLIKLYICNNKIHTQKSKVLHFFDKLKFDKKADIAMHSRSTQSAMFLKLT